MPALPDVSDCAQVSENAVDKLFKALPRLQTVISKGVEKDVVSGAIKDCMLMPA